MLGRSIALDLAVSVAFACLCWMGGCGGEGARCNTNAGCDEGLVCDMGACVIAGGTGGIAGSGGTGGAGGSGATGGASGTGGIGGAGGAPGTCDPANIDAALCGADCACDPEAPSICGTICIDPICGGFQNFDTAGCGDDGRCVCICVETFCTN